MKRTLRWMVWCVGFGAVLSLPAGAAEAPYNVAWSRQIGTSDTDVSFSVAADGQGNAYISGYTAGNLAGTSAGGEDAFLTKYADNGTLLWSQQIGTSADDRSDSVAVDGQGNVYISGWTRGNLDGQNAGNADAFLVKYADNGTLLWSRQIGTNTIDYSNSVAVDGQGNAYITGYTYGNLGGPNAGGWDAFLVKYADNGTLLWSRQVGTSYDDYGYSVAVDGQGNVYISGFTSGSLGGPNAGGWDAFLVKYGPSGNVVWSRQIGTSSEDQSHGMAVDASGNAYISGHTYGSLGGPNAGASDAFLTKYDGGGNFLWSRQIGTSNYDYSKSVAVDGQDNVYISGHTEGSLGGPNAGLNDAFLIKYDPDGNLLWSRQIGTGAEDYGYSVAVDGQGHAYISGHTSGSLGGPNAGRADAFLVKYQAPAPLTVSGSVVLSDYTPTDPRIPVAVLVEVRQWGNPVLVAQKILDANGQFTLENAPQGTFEVAVKTMSHLRKVQTATINDNVTDLGIFTLISGDLNNDNAVTSTDLSINLANMDLVGDP